MINKYIIIKNIFGIKELRILGMYEDKNQSL